MATEQYTCPQCGKPVVAASAGPGERVTCGECGHSFKIPAPSQSDQFASSDSGSSTATVGGQTAFDCPFCDSRLYADPTEETIVCPDCLESVAVPRPASRSEAAASPSAVENRSHVPPDSRPESDEGARRLDSEGEDSADDDDDEFRLAPLDDDDESLPIGPASSQPAPSSPAPSSPATRSPRQPGRGPTESQWRGPAPDSQSLDEDDEDELKLAPLEPRPEDLPGLELDAEGSSADSSESLPGRPVTSPKPGKRKVRRYGITCGVCDTRLDVSEDDIGTTIECPDCGTSIVVEPPPKHKKLTPVDWDESAGDELRVSEAEELEVFKEMAQQSEQKAVQEEQVELERKRKAPGELPKNPLKENALRCFSHWRAWAIVGAIALAQSLHFGTVFLIAGMLEENPILGVLAGLFIGIPVFLVTAVATIFYAMAMLTDSAEGWDELQELAPFDLGAWLTEAGFVALAVVYSLLPLSPLAALGAVGLPFWLIGVLLLVSWFFLFPFVLLSMLENASLVGPFSKEIWRAMRKHRRPWQIFYAETAVIVVVTTAVMFIPVWFFLVPLVATVFALAVAIYFRLLGRLAWWLSRLD